MRGMKLIFVLKINTKVFYQLMASLWVWVARHAESNEDKFAISLQYLKENLRDEVDFLPVEKRQRVLQIDTIILGVCGQSCPDYPK